MLPNFKVIYAKKKKLAPVYLSVCASKQTSDKPWNRQAFCTYCSVCLFVFSFLEGSVVDHRDVTLQAVKQRYADDDCCRVSEIEVSTD